jgi:hypothetical protein
MHFIDYLEACEEVCRIGLQVKPEVNARTVMLGVQLAVLEKVNTINHDRMLEKTKGEVKGILFCVDPRVLTANDLPQEEKGIIQTALAIVDYTLENSEGSEINGLLELDRRLHPNSLISLVSDLTSKIDISLTTLKQTLEDSKRK